MKKLKRNTLAVRLEDKDYNKFLRVADKNYSLTLRELVRVYNQHSRPEDWQLKGPSRVKKVLSRVK